MLLLENKFIQLSLNTHNKVAYATWYKQTAFMSNEDYQKTLCQLMDAFIKHQPKALLGNDYQFCKPIPPELQKWTANQLNPQLEASGLRKMAFTASKDFIGDLSIQQSVEEIQKMKGRKQVVVRYFESLTDAEQWVYAEV